LSFFSYTACPNTLIVVRSRITAVNIFAALPVLVWVNLGVRSRRNAEFHRGSCMFSGMRNLA
jgi:hypothetical protein